MMMNDMEMSSFHITVVNFLYALFCGVVIGVEREVKRKRAGIKTNTLICIGSALITTFSMLTSRESGEQVRIVAQIVSGVGFLGAGAIIQAPGDKVSGLTTAALIWVVSGLGIGIGMGHGPTCAFLSVFLVVLTHIITLAERRYFPRREVAEAEPIL